MRYLTIILSIFMVSCGTLKSFNLRLIGDFPERHAFQIKQTAPIAYKKINSCRNKEVQKRLKIYKQFNRVGFNQVEIKAITKGLKRKIKIDYKLCGLVLKVPQRINTKNTLYIHAYPDLFDKKRCSYVETIGHEMLHNLGFSHRNVRETVEFENLLEECGLSY